MKFDKKFATLHGYLCADGYVSRNLPHQKHKYYSIELRNTNYILLKDFYDLFYSVFGIKPKLIRGERCRKYSKEIYYKLMENGPYHSHVWKFPNISNNLSKHWLRAFFDCEGWVISDRRQTRSVCLESVNRNQLPKIQKTLLDLKIDSFIYKRKNRSTSILVIPNKKSLINFKENIGFLHPKKKAKLNKAIGSFID